VVGELPAVRQDAARLLAAVPVQLWRQLGVRPGAVVAGEESRDG
jgi:hypothetical protein